MSDVPLLARGDLFADPHLGRATGVPNETYLQLIAQDISVPQHLNDLLAPTRADVAASGSALAVWIHFSTHAVS